ncbi:hypothetical protein EN813_009980 [Mesorhizobium sp. M00.F.Ca.ET.170.01.1.1]|nr:hypothetical protein EN813_009980 [Mesorhizobium sp. M00.F.Ca.ET.170.01.1.1]
MTVSRSFSRAWAVNQLRDDINVPCRNIWTPGGVSAHSSVGERGLDKSRYDNRSDQWRKRSGSRRSRALRWASVPRRLIFVTVAAAGALAAQAALKHADGLHEINLSNLIGPKPQPIIGVASVIDGDTIEVHGQRIRFNGIDAPESKQYCDDAKGFEYPCGRRSAEALDTFLVASRPVQCAFVTWDRYHRYVGDCRRADGSSVAAWMVEHGQALDWPRYSSGAYTKQQAKAEAAKVGLWVGKFEAPWDWRASHADGTAPSSQPLGIMSRKLVAQSGYSCEPRRTCKQISSCDEAQWYLQNCSWGGKLDRDGDGVACETLC